MAENYRRALTEEEIPSAFKNVYGNRTKKPISVKGAKTAVDIASPLPTIIDIQKELDKKDPSYVKIAGLAGLELLGSAAPVVELAAKSANKSVLQKIVDYFKKNPDKEYDPEAAKVSAKDLGFGEDVYHFTTSKKIKGDKFNPDLSIGNWNRMGIHVGAKKAAADRFRQTQGIDKYEDGKALTELSPGEYFEADAKGMTIPLKARTDKPLLFDGEIKSEFAIIGKLQEMAVKKGIGKDGDYATALRKELAKEGYTHIPYINEVENEGAISYIMLTDRPKKSSAVLRSKFADFDPDKIDKPELGLAEGGAVMNEQMQMAFMNEGGLKDDGMNKDPVSGNEVPSGSMAKEVRDDIPAQLSEGEYVVPADVVRYYGVKFFEDLRERAKMGLQEMEMNGRIGGEPVPAGGPINDEELSPQEMQAIQEMMGMAEGGTVNMYKQQQELYTAPNPAIGNTVEMNQGGQVSGYSNSSDVTNPNNVASQTEQGFLQQGQQAQQRGFVGFPLGATIFPSEKTGQTVLGPVGTQVATTGAIDTAVNPEPAEEVSSVTLYSPDYLTDNQTITLTLPVQSDLYNQKIAEGWTTEMPVAGAPVVKGGGDDDDDDDKVTTDPNAWMDKFNYNDFGKLGTQTSDMLKKAPVGGAIGAFINGSTAAQAAANIIIMEANGQNVDFLKADWKKFVDSDLVLKNLPKELINGDRFAKDIVLNNRDIGLFKDSKDIFGNDIFKTDEDWNNFMDQTAPEGMSYDPSSESYKADDDRDIGQILGGTQIGTSTGSDGTTVKVYKPGSDTVKPPSKPKPPTRSGSNGSGDDNNSTPVSTASGGGRGSSGWASAVDKATDAGISTSVASNLSGAGMTAGSEVGSGPGGSDYAGPMNKGGLMTKGKNKK